MIIKDIIWIAKKKRTTIKSLKGGKNETRNI